MTAYAPTWTGRLRVSYFAARAAHTQVWRFPGPSSGSGVTDLITVLSDFYTALNPILYNDFTINALTVADVDSPVFIPIINTLDALGGAVAMTDFEPEEKANFATFVGRTTAGGPWHISQYGIAFPGLEDVGGKNFRIVGNENADILTAIGVLQAGAGSIIGNDAAPPAIYNYVNLKANDRWVKKVRRGA